MSIVEPGTKHDATGFVTCLKQRAQALTEVSAESHTEPQVKQGLCSRYRLAGHHRG
jgi:hypothetical protein